MTLLIGQGSMICINIERKANRNIKCKTITYHSSTQSFIIQLLGIPVALQQQKRLKVLQEETAASQTLQQNKYF